MPSALPPFALPPLTSTPSPQPRETAKCPTTSNRPNRQAPCHLALKKRLKPPHALVAVTSVRATIQQVEASLRSRAIAEPAERTARRVKEVKRRVETVLSYQGGGVLNFIDLSLDSQPLRWYRGDPRGRMCFWFCMGRLVRCPSRPSPTSDPSRPSCLAHGDPLPRHSTPHRPLPSNHAAITMQQSRCSNHD